MYHRILCERVSEDAYQAGLLLADEYGYDKPRKRLKRHLPSALVTALFLQYNPVTKYQYENELERKQQRLMESLLSDQDRWHMRDSFNTGARVWFTQARQYIDFAVDDGREAAFDDAGVDEVVWVTQKDEKVCKECG